MFEPLFARLANRYHLVAPDYPGFGHSDWPDPKKFAYTFDHYAEIMNHFTEVCRSGTIAWENWKKLPAADLPARLKAEIEQFFLSATFFTDKRAKVMGWRGPRAAHKLVNASLTGGNVASRLKFRFRSKSISVLTMRALGSSSPKATNSCGQAMI
jgi:hypothetical protein